MRSPWFASFATTLAAAAALLGAVPSSTPAIDAYAKGFEAQAAAHRAQRIFANFAGDGTRYVAYPSERAYAKALAAFESSPRVGGGSYVARTYRVPGSAGLFVTFDPVVMNSLPENERALYAPDGRILRAHVEQTSFNGYYKLVRDAYYRVDGSPLSDRTIRYDYAPADAKFARAIKSSTATPDQIELAIYPTRAKLPFRT